MAEVQAVAVPSQGRPRAGLVNPGSAAAEPFRALRLALQLRAEKRRGNCLLFTSVEPEAGKSTIAANYALVASLGQHSVLLVDGDLRRPTLHEIFEISRTPGLVDVLAGGLGLEHVAHRISWLGQLSVLPAGRRMEQTGDIASSPRMGEILREAAMLYGVVVVDAPPILHVSDAEGLASHPGVDVVLVVRRTTRRRVMVKAMRRLELLDANVVGLVVNREGRLGAYGY